MQAGVAGRLGGWVALIQSPSFEGGDGPRGLEQRHEGLDTLWEFELL
jgi:hypothetical protein